MRARVFLWAAIAAMTMTAAEAREASSRAIVAAARIDSCVFTDAFFGYTAAPFQKRWHQAWDAPSAHVVHWAPIEHGKTQRATGWALHRVATDPKNTRLLWLGASQSAGLKSTGIIKRAIEEPTPFLQTAFPTLAPGSGKWTQAQFTVAGASTTEKDCTIETAGLESQVLGGRFTDIVMDDICTMKTTLTADTRAKVTQLILSTILGRLLDGGRILLLGNAWYPDDVMHSLAERGFTVIREEAYKEDDEGRIVKGSVLWPEQWPEERLGALPNSVRADDSMTKRKELGTIEAQRQLRCIPYSAGQGRFKMQWFDKAMAAGAGFTLLGPTDKYLGEHGPAFVGVDLGVSQKEGSDLSSFFALAVHPKTGKRMVLDAFEERIDGPTTISRLKDWHRRLGASMRVENNAAQDFIRQWALDEGIPTSPHTTGKNKADISTGVPSLGVELEQGMWVLPCGDERSQAIAIKWRTQCLAYSPGQHTGDMLMASWFAREQARLGEGVSAVAKSATPTRANYSRLNARYGSGGPGPLIGRRR